MTVCRKFNKLKEVSLETMTKITQLRELNIIEDSDKDLRKAFFIIAEYFDKLKDKEILNT